MWKCRSCPALPIFHNMDDLRNHLLASPHHSHHHHRHHQHYQNLEQEISACKLGRDAYDHFWCGFCRSLIETRADANVETNAWDERSRHIGEHFDKQGMKSEDWVCVEENRRLGDLKKRRSGEEHGGEEEEEEEGFPEYEAGFQQQQSQQDFVEGMYMSTSSSPLKRKLEEETDADGVSDYDLR